MKAVWWCSVQYDGSECGTQELCSIDSVPASRFTMEVAVGITFKVT